MKEVFSLPFLAVSIVAFVLSSCASSGDVYPSGEPTDDQLSSESEPDFSHYDFYYHDASEFPSDYQSPYHSGYSYFCGVGDCPICHQHPCIGHQGRSSSWSHHEAGGGAAHDGHHHHGSDSPAHDDHNPHGNGSSSVAHDGRDHHGSNTVAQHDKSNHHDSSSDKTGKGRDDRASASHSAKPVSHPSAADYQLLQSRSDSRSSYSSSSSHSSSSGSSGHSSSGGSSSKSSSSKSDDDKKKN